MDRAIAAAQSAAPGWAASTPQQRFDVLDFVGTEILARKEELGRLLSRKKARPCPKGLAKRPAPVRSSSILPANVCARRAITSPLSARASRSMSAAAPSVLSD
jgi:hypothetical protein